MSSQIRTFTVTPSTDLSLWKYLWRGEAAINILFGDALIFATAWVIDLTGMSDNMTTLVRVAGVVFSLYGLWQLWSARTGSISRNTFLAGDAVMTLTGLEFFAAILLTDFNTTGKVLMVSLGIICWATAALWYFAARQMTS